jgi:hypothetical protein
VDRKEEDAGAFKKPDDGRVGLKNLNVESEKSPKNVGLSLIEYPCLLAGAEDGMVFEGA